MQEVSYADKVHKNKLIEEDVGFNYGQRQLYKEVIERITSEDGNIIFLMSLEEKEKPFSLIHCLQKLEDQKKIAFVAASSGSAVTLLMDGTTAHPELNLLIDLNNCKILTSNMSKQQS